MKKSWRLPCAGAIFFVWGMPLTEVNGGLEFLERFKIGGVAHGVV
jgi:hypothetical protein